MSTRTQGARRPKLLTLSVVIAALTLPAQVHAAGQELIADGSFEAGAGSGNWTEASTSFGTPLCTVAECGTGDGSGPRTGSVWAWFGGTEFNETASVSQAVPIPTGTASLSFYLEIPACDNSPSDTFAVRVDGATVFSTNSFDPACGLTGYLKKTINIDEYADSSSHTIEVRGVFTSAGVGNTNFMVDDISLLAIAQTTTMLSLVKTATDIQASGAVSPPHPMKKMRVILYQDTGSGFVQIGTKLPKAGWLERVRDVLLATGRWGPMQGEGEVPRRW